MINNNIICENATEENGVLYFVNYYNSALYLYDKNKKISKRLGQLPTQSNMKKRMFEAIHKKGNKIYIAPSFYELQIAIFDLSKNEFKYIDLAKYVNGDIGLNYGFKFDSIIPYENYIYLIGRLFPGVVRINTDDDTVLILNSWDSLTKKDRNKWMFINGFVEDNIAYLPFVEFPAFVKLDLKTSETTLVRFDTKIKKFSGMTKGINNDLWFLGHDEPCLINVSLNGERSIEYYFDIPETKNASSLFENLVRDEKGIYLFPLCVNNIYYFDFNKLTCEVCSEFCNITKNEFCGKYESPRVFSFITNNQVYIVERNCKIWHELNLNDRTYKSFNVFEDEKYVLKIWGYGIKESQKYKLDDLFEIINLYC